MCDCCLPWQDNWPGVGVYSWLLRDDFVLKYGKRWYTFDVNLKRKGRLFCLAYILCLLGQDAILLLVGYRWEHSAHHCYGWYWRFDPRPGLQGHRHPHQDSSRTKDSGQNHQRHWRAHWREGTCEFRQVGRFAFVLLWGCLCYHLNCM